MRSGLFSRCPGHRHAGMCVALDAWGHRWAYDTIHWVVFALADAFQACHRYAHRFFLCMAATVIKFGCESDDHLVLFMLQSYQGSLCMTLLCDTSHWQQVSFGYVFATSEEGRVVLWHEGSTMPCCLRKFQVAALHRVLLLIDALEEL